MDLQQQELFTDEINKSNRDKAMMYEKAISPFLTRLERIFVTARKAEKLSTISQKIALRKLLDIITKAYGDSGLPLYGRSKSHQFNYLSDTTKVTYSQLMDLYPNITLEEVRLALTNGIRHAYGQFYSINTNTICDFVGKFLKDPDRTAAFRKQNKYIDSLIEKPQPQRSDEEISISCLQSCKETYRKTGILIDGGRISYKYCVKMGYIQFTEKTKEAIFEQAIIETDKEEQENKLKFGRNRFQTKSEDELQFAYECQAMTITLRRYFDYLFIKEKGLLRKPVDLSVPVEEYLKNINNEDQTGNQE